MNEQKKAQAKYRGYVITDNGKDGLTITLDSVELASGLNDLTECRAAIDEDICERKAANAKKMGRHENNPNDLI